MDAMNIIPPRPLGDRKRTWDEEEYEPSKKRTFWIRERPQVTELEYPIIQQVQNLTLGTQGNDVQMIMDEPKPVFLPPSPVSRPISPLPAMHSTSTFYPPINHPGTSTQPTTATITPELTRSSDPTQVSSNLKKRFALGPRADCQRCLTRESGHYGHWL
ncbi:unnamed protein product [Rhizoctonia solani]|uniref:Uncharacterized protein n=1 Tax=Rhizoctonia solani TaxID=456999 RepID=A0A8H2WLG3_9AGAM|nr:unnamed protein product [Rhizoctonia solani]CAE6525853.1 unnamed protein product [Rhizoctonia solani]